jgi:poly-gamma-glutamate synthesis protein (capsule biosynthesis protein)
MPVFVGAGVVVALLLAVGVGFGSGLLGGGGGASPSAVAAGPSATPGDVASGPPDPSGSGDPSSGPGASGDPSASPDPEPSEVPLVETDVAIAPVTSFRSPRDAIDKGDVTATAAGDGPFRGLVLVEDDADAILAALDLERADLGKRLTTVATADELKADLADHRRRLGFLRADDIGPEVRALGWGDRQLFGVDRVKRLERWPLTARMLGPEVPGYDPATAWTLVAGGDILLDRGVKLAIDANGADFPFDGGTVEITGRCPDCSAFGWDLPYTERTGNAGIVRDLLRGADLAIANFENPAPNNPVWHGSGTVFNANPEHIDALVDAGLDWVSLANNHIGDAGRKGMLQTLRNLDKRGLAHSGLGKDLDDAHEAALLEAGGVTVGLLGYDMIAPSYHAGEDLAGSAGMSKKALKRDIRRARAAGADVVIVFPHWGIEYRANPSETQQRMGRAAIDAGADMVIGAHPHWAEGMEVYEGKPIWYSLGNFIFDQTWSEYTMEGLLLELTFDGEDLVQARLHPHLILGKAQPNLMDPSGTGGKFVLDQVWDASEGRLDW